MKNVSKKQLNVNNVIIKVIIILIAVTIGIYCTNKIIELNMFLNEVGISAHDRVEEVIMKWWWGIAFAAIGLIIGLIIPSDKNLK